MHVLTDRKIIVTGGDGFLGTYLVQHLQDLGVRNMFVPRSKHYDLTDLDSANRLLRDYPPDMMIHLAASCPYIDDDSGKSDNNYNPMEHPDVVMWRNMLIAAKHNNVPEMVTVWDYHAYPSWCQAPYSEQVVSDISKWEDYDNYRSHAEVFLHEMMQYSAGQHGNYKITAFITSEVYGSGDRFHHGGRRLISSTIRAVSDAKENGESAVDVPGHPLDKMDFVFAGDAVDGIVNAIVQGTEGGVINIASGDMISWSEVVEQITARLDYLGDIHWMDKARDPYQQSLNTTATAKKYGFKPATDFRMGLSETVQWFCTHRRFILENEADMTVPWEQYQSRESSSMSVPNMRNPNQDEY